MAEYKSRADFSGRSLGYSIQSEYKSPDGTCVPYEIIVTQGSIIAIDSTDGILLIELQMSGDEPIVGRIAPMEYAMLMDILGLINSRQEYVNNYINNFYERDNAEPI